MIYIAPVLNLKLILEDNCHGHMQKISGSHLGLCFLVVILCFGC